MRDGYPSVEWKEGRKHGHPYHFIPHSNCGVETNPFKTLGLYKMKTSEVGICFHRFKILWNWREFCRCLFNKSPKTFNSYYMCKQLVWFHLILHKNKNPSCKVSIPYNNVTNTNYFYSHFVTYCIIKLYLVHLLKWNYLKQSSEDITYKLKAYNKTIHIYWIPQDIYNSQNSMVIWCLRTKQICSTHLYPEITTILIHKSEVICQHLTFTHYWNKNEIYQLQIQKSWKGRGWADWSWDRGSDLQFSPYTSSIKGYFERIQHIYIIQMYNGFE